jgi:hypothetical protein
VMFIPKHRKASYTEVNAYCPISLWSLLLKTMEKLVVQCDEGSTSASKPVCLLGT